MKHGFCSHPRHDIALCTELRVREAGCKGHGGCVRTYIHRSTQIRKNRLLTTLHVYRYVITKGNVTWSQTVWQMHTGILVTLCYSVVTFTVTIAINTW